jgi:hypothetical protein
MDSAGEFLSGGWLRVNPELTARTLMDDAFTSVRYVTVCVRGRTEIAGLVRQLWDSLNCLPHIGTWAVDDQFRAIYPLESHLHSIFPPTLKGDIIVLIVLAHSLAVILMMSARLPVIDQPFYTNPRLLAILNIGRSLQNVDFVCDKCQAVHSADVLMRFPLEAAWLHYFRKTSSPQPVVSIQTD